MSEGLPVSSCLDDETLAALVEGRLDDVRRNHAMSHIGRCNDCYDMLADVATALPEFEAAFAVTVPAANVAPARRRRFFIGAAVLSAAAVLVLAVAVPLWRSRAFGARPELAELVSAEPSARPVDGRLTGGFAWAPFDAVRGVASSPSPGVQIAAAHLEQAVSRERSASNLAAFGTSRLLVDDIPAAIAALEEATALDRSRPEYWSDLASAYLARAQTPGMESNLPRALDAVDTAIAERHSLPEAWFNKAVILEKLGLVDQARDAWTTYLGLDPSSSWRAEAEQRRNALGRPAPSSGKILDVEPARQKLFGALLDAWSSRVAAHAPDDETRAALRSAADEIAAASDDRMPADLIASIERASGSAAAKQAMAQGAGAFVRAERAMAKNDFDVATSELAVARPSLQRMRSPLAMVSEYDEAVISYRRAGTDDAYQRLLPLRDAAAAAGYRAIVGRMDWMLGLIDSLQGRQALASTRYNAAVGDFAAAADPANAVTAQALQATVLDALGESDRAWPLRIAAMRATRRSGVFLTASLSASQQGLNRAALVFAETALTIARQAGSAPNIADGLRAEATLHAALGDTAAVPALLAQAHSWVADRQEPAWNRVRAEIALAEAKAARGPEVGGALLAADAAIEYFTQTNARLRLPELYDIRSRLHHRAGNDEAATEDARRGLDILDAERANVARGADQATFEATGRNLAADLTVLVTTGSAADTFGVIDRSRGRDLDSDVRRPTLADVRKALPAATAFIEFVVGDEASCAWIATRDTVHFERIPIGRAALADLIRAAGPPRGDAGAVLTLSRTLMWPIETVARRATRLVIVPDGPLYALSFGALRLETGEYVIARHSVLMAPSALHWMSSTMQLRGFDVPPRNIAAIGAPRLDADRYPGLAALPQAQAEVAEIVDDYPGHALRLEGEQATRAAVIEAASRADVLHFAGHSVVNALVPDASFLALAGAEPSRLTASDIRRLHFSSLRLVVLASCDSATSGRADLDSPLSLSRAFMAAGVPAVVGSLWLASDRASRVLFDGFHREFARTGDAAEALRRAQMTLATSADPTMSAARQWAGFVVTGGSKPE